MTARTANTSRVKFRVLVTREGDQFSACGLEHYVATQADSLDALADELGRMLWAYVTLDSLENIQPAPRPVWDLFERAMPLGMVPVGGSYEAPFEVTVRIAA